MQILPIFTFASLGGISLIVINAAHLSFILVQVVVRTSTLDQLLPSCLSN